jgi:hypothetical protein
VLTIIVDFCIVFLYIQKINLLVEGENSSLAILEDFFI